MKNVQSKRRVPRLLCFFALFSMAGGARGEAIAIGSIMPKWRDLPGADGKRHSSEDIGADKAVLVVFFANHCPDCELYLPRILEIVNQYQGKGVEAVLVSVSKKTEDDLAHMAKLVKEKKIPCLYLQDKSQKIGKDFGAETTPEIFLFDSRRVLKYHGGIDDHWKLEKVKRRHLRLALDEVLAGKPVAMPTTEPQGCSIEYED